MTTNLDTSAINHMTVAINAEVSRHPGRRHADLDTLFFGGEQATRGDLEDLADFSARRNWQVVYAQFDPAQADGVPSAFHVAVTDGSRAVVLKDGRLWKRDRKTPSVLVFADAQVVARMNDKCRLKVRSTSARFHDHGYELAREAIIAGAGRKPGKVPVVGPVGTLMTVQDLGLIAASLEAA